MWSYPNTHGDVAATRVNGTVTAFNWDPYGNPVGTVPDNSAGTADWGWLGQHQRTLDHPSGLNPVIEMGARVYQPDTGRFQQTDPIEDGTTTNPYSYVPDPINQYDLNGQWCMLGTIKTVGPDGKTHKKCRGRRVAQRISGVARWTGIGLAAGAVLIGAVVTSPAWVTAVSVAGVVALGLSVTAEALDNSPCRGQRIVVAGVLGLLFGGAAGALDAAAASGLSRAVTAADIGASSKLKVGC